MFFAGHFVAMVTYYVMERTTTCSPIIGQCFDIMIVASSDKEWLQSPIEILVLETVLSHLKTLADDQIKKLSFPSSLISLTAGKIVGGACSLSGVVLITPLLPIIFNKFSRFQNLEDSKRITQCWPRE